MKYTDLQDQDKRGLEFSKLYNNIDPLIRNAGSYRLEYVGINTASPDFSPSFIKMVWSLFQAETQTTP